MQHLELRRLTNVSPSSGDVFIHRAGHKQPIISYPILPAASKCDLPANFDRFLALILISGPQGPPTRCRRLPLQVFSFYLSACLVYQKLEYFITISCMYHPVRYGPAVTVHGHSSCYLQRSSLSYIWSVLTVSCIHISTHFSQQSKWPFIEAHNCLSSPPQKTHLKSGMNKITFQNLSTGGNKISFRVFTAFPVKVYRQAAGRVQ